MAQEQDMQEKLKNMSPEELKAFQIQNCIFCHIVKGKVASKKVYEDDKCLAILDINPANPGHVLLLPKEHYAIMPLIPDDIIQHLFMISKQISAALLKALKAQGTNIFVANGAAAGQKAQHFMIHVIPRMENDGLNLELEPKPISEKMISDLHKVLVEKIAKDLGVKPVEIQASKDVKNEPKEETNPENEDKFVEDKETGFLEPAEEKKKKAKKSSKPKKEPKPEEVVTLDDISNLIKGIR
jgi:histidine triad (HIT) family protein